jgi:hypothetical protein
VDVPCRRSLGLFQFDLEGPRGVRRIHQVLQFADTGIGRSVLPIHKSCNRHLVTAFLPYRWWLHCAQRRALLDVRDQCSSEHSNSQRAAVQRFFRLLCTRFGWIKAVFSHEQVAGLRLHCCLQTDFKLHINANANMENANKPEQLQAITARILQNLKNLSGLNSVVS